MTESESVALPLGDTAILPCVLHVRYYITLGLFCQVFFQKNPQKIFFFLRLIFRHCAPEGSMRGDIGNSGKKVFQKRGSRCPLSAAPGSPAQVRGAAAPPKTAGAGVGEIFLTSPLRPIRARLPIFFRSPPARFSDLAPPVQVLRGGSGASGGGGGGYLFSVSDSVPFFPIFPTRRRKVCPCCQNKAACRP